MNPDAASQGTPGERSDNASAPAGVVLGDTSIQLLVPGAYAWAVTVAPAAWASGSGALPKVSAGCALSALAAGAWLAYKKVHYARIVSLWGFVLGCAFAWVTAPAYALEFVATMGIAGSFGWAVFAFAAAAPSLARSKLPQAERAVVLRPRQLTRSDAVQLALAGVVACGFQSLGWGAFGAERAVLVRVVCLAASVASLLLVTRYVEIRAVKERLPRLRPAVLTAAALVALLVATAREFPSVLQAALAIGAGTP